MLSGTKELYEFGPFRLDPVERRLTRDDAIVLLTPKVFDTLLVLTRNSGRLLEKNELMRQIWPDSFVEESNLAQSISILRKALGEQPHDRCYIQTVPGHGYRFLLPVRTIASPYKEPVPLGPELQAVAEAHAHNSAKPLGRLPLHVIIAAFSAFSAVCGVLIWRTAAPHTHQSTYEQLTDFTDSAIAPVLSPDGRTVAFIRGNDWFLSPNQIWLKSLPGGEPVQLTHDPRNKFAPAFSPDGSHIVYSATEPSHTAWLTLTVPVLGGEPRLMFRNAEGLTWMKNNQLLFSEVKTGMHMAIVTASENRSGTRDVYVPEHHRAMAHFSHASPDGKWVLVIEMDATATWQPCRLVPFDGSSRGKQVGPSGQCSSAGWSPDGAWMFFTVQTAAGDSHLWRQRFPNGAPEQITSGPTKHQGVAVAPDGHSVITSIGMEQSAIWIHDLLGDQPLSSVGYAFSPVFSRDGRHVYYLLRRGSGEGMVELWIADVRTRESERLLSGFPITSYDVSDDGGEAVFAAKPVQGQSQIWLASLDRRSSPRQIASGGEDAPYFGPDGQILFRQSENSANYLFRMNRDGSRRAKVASYAINSVMSMSPDRRWAASLAPVNDIQANAAEIAIPVQGGIPIRICSGFCGVMWAPDGNFLYVTFDAALRANAGTTAAIPVPAARTLPDLPASGISSLAEAVAISGGVMIQQSNLAPGLDPRVFAYRKVTMHRNLFRIPL